jgi:hypothetical protein
MASRHSEGSKTSDFWNNRLFLVAVVLASVVPLLWPEVPPLTDLPGHMGRYKVQLDIDSSTSLGHFYGFEWSVIGNLGVDLLVIPLARIFGLELAVKLLVMSIPALTVAGFLWVAREVHGRVPPTAFFALPFAYGHPFIFGFVNFALSMAFAFLAFALWLRLARFGRFRLRAALFVPISLLLWVTHTFGWGTLGLLAFSAEAVRQHDEGRSYLRAAIGSAVHCLALTAPLILMFAWRSGQVGGVTADWFNWKFKLRWVLMALRDRWQLFDLAALALAVVVMAEAIRNKKLEYSRNLAFSALVLLAMFVLLPRIVFGSAYADMRLVPFVFAVALIAIRARAGADGRYIKWVAIAGLAFFFVRLAGNTVSFWMYDRAFDRALAALDQVPPGAKMVSFVGETCTKSWFMHRLYHLPGLAIVRKEAFSNDQWVMAGAQLLRVKYGQGRPFLSDPSQVVTLRKCRNESYRPIDGALAQVPREAFDYVWLIHTPPHDPRLTQGFRPIWRSGSSILYRVERGGSGEDRDQGNAGR